MRYFSFDIEATGLSEHDLVIEFASVPFDTEENKIEERLSFHRYVKCPSYDSLLPQLDPWVAEHNKDLIKKSNSNGIELSVFAKEFEEHLTSADIRSYFHIDDKTKIVLFGKSLNAIDLPFLNRDLGWDFMRRHFNHQVLDLSSVVRALVDMKKLPATCVSGGGLMQHLSLGEVAHTALEDAVNTAKMYLMINQNIT